MGEKAASDSLWNLRNLPALGRPSWRIVARVSPEREGGPEALCLLSMDPTGYIREAAVRRMGDVSDDFALPMLLSRLNDWVLEVRTEARRVLEELWSKAFIGEEGEALLLDLLPFFWRLSKARRVDTSWILDKLWARLSEDDARILKASGNTSIPPKTWRWAIQGLLISGFRPRDPEPWFQSPDLVLRLRFLRLLHEDLPEEILLRTLDEMDNSKAAFLRKESLYARMAHFPEQSQEQLIHALADPSTGIRNTARFYLRKQGFDIRGHLTGLVQQTDASPRSWLALADVATEEDRALMESQISSPVPRNRLAAYIYSLKQGDPDERILDGLCNPLPRVARQMQRICQRSKRRLSVPMLLDRMNEHLPSSYRRPLLRILEQQSSVHCLLQLLSHRAAVPLPPTELQLLRNLVTRLSCRQFTIPDPEVLDKLEQLLALPNEDIPPETIQELKRIHRTWRQARGG